MPPQQSPYSDNLPSQNYQAEEDSNTIAIIGLILAFIIPLAGLICSIIGLNKAKALERKKLGRSDSWFDYFDTAANHYNFIFSRLGIFGIYSARTDRFSQKRRRINDSKCD